MPKEDKKSKKVIKKKTRVTVSNTMNQMIFEQKDMTLQAFRMIMFYLAKINPKCPEFTMVKVPLETYAAMLGVELNEKAIDESTTLLMGYVLKTGEIDKGEYIIRNTKYNIFSVCQLVERKSDGKLALELQCSEHVKPLIFEMKEKFTGFSVWNVLNLSNFQDIRMYMLLSQYKVAGRQTFTLEELKDKLGISKEAYPEYKIFVRAVLKKCQQALKERTDICFEFKSVGRPARAVKFDIFPNSDYKILKYLEDPEEPEEDAQPQIPAPDPVPEQLDIDTQKIPEEPAPKPEPVNQIRDVHRQARIDIVRSVVRTYDFTDDELEEVVIGVEQSEWWKASRAVFLGYPNEQEIAFREYVEAQYAYTKSRSKSKTRDGFKKYLVKAVRNGYEEVEVFDPKTKAKDPNGSFAPKNAPRENSSFDTQEFFEAAVKRSMGDNFDPEIFENLEK